MMQSKQKTLRQVREEFFESGTVISEWADMHHFNRPLVYAVMSGRSKGNRGESHRIAVALGIKPNPAATREALLQQKKIKTGNEDLLEK